MIVTFHQRHGKKWSHCVQLIGKQQNKSAAFSLKCSGGYNLEFQRPFQEFVFLTISFSYLDIQAQTDVNSILISRP